MKIIEITGNAPPILYHHTFVQNRQSIQRYGLLRARDQSGNEYGGIFLSSHPEFSEGTDVWQVDVRGLNIEPDETGAFPENPEETWWVDYEEDISPNRLKLLSPFNGTKS